jgi:hypothetical protein
LNEAVTKDVIGYEGLYKISSGGDVIRVGRWKPSHNRIQWIPEITMKPQVMPNGYEVVYLSKDGKPKIQYIHRLVALAFILNPLGYKEVNHIDECKINNDIKNLEWCSRKYNVNYGTARKRAVQKIDYKKTTANCNFKEMARLSALKQSRPVNQINSKGNPIATYPSATEAARALNFNAGDICSCCRGKLKHAKGFVWQYAE